VIILFRTKYVEKKHLCNYELDIELFKKLGLEVQDLYPVRGVYILCTSKGKKVLKIIDYSIERLEFINKGINYIKKEYSNVININKLNNGTIFTEWMGKKYILLDLIEGIECNVANPIDLALSSEGLAKLHKASKNFCEIGLTKEEKMEYSNLFNKPFYFNNAKKEIIKIKRQLDGYLYKNQFDKLFLADADYYIKEISQCMRMLEESKYSELCCDNNAIVFCHNDLAHHNIIIKDNEAYFIDFDYASIDLRVWDVGNFINKTVKKFGFNIDMCKEIIDKYNKISPLKKEELELLYIFLKFPHDFYVSSRNYYYKLKAWDEEVFLSRFQTKVGYREEREFFLKNLQKEIYNM
jgi:CotS family spore coat protein